MVGTTAIAKAKTWLFEYRTTWNPTFRISNGRISDPHCINYNGRVSIFMNLTLCSMRVEFCAENFLLLSVCVYQKTKGPFLNNTTQIWPKMVWLFLYLLTIRSFLLFPKKFNLFNKQAILLKFLFYFQIANGMDLATYLTRFQWDMAKYPIKQSLKNLSDMIAKQVNINSKLWQITRQMLSTSNCLYHRQLFKNNS